MLTCQKALWTRAMGSYVPSISHGVDYSIKARRPTVVIHYALLPAHVGGPPGDTSSCSAAVCGPPVYQVQASLQHSALHPRWRHACYCDTSASATRLKNEVRVLTAKTTVIPSRHNGARAFCSSLDAGRNLRSISGEGFWRGAPTDMPRAMRHWDSPYRLLPVPELSRGPPSLLPRPAVF